MVARIYGVTGTWTSHASVTRGFVRGLIENGAFSGLLSLNEDYESASDELRNLAGGVDAPFGILTGGLNESAKLTQWGNHEHRFAMVAPNSMALPQKLMNVLSSDCTGLIGPSGWACDVIRKYTSLPVYKAPHGLDAEFHPKKDGAKIEPITKAVTALHFSTSDRERKGTFELIQAWAYLKDSGRIPANARLRLILNDMIIFKHEKRLAGVEKWGIEVIRRPNNGLGLPPDRIANALRRADLVIQPSRGEGFGLIPLSALACGTPVVATSCTGHSEYLSNRSLQDGVVTVQTGGYSPIDDLPGEPDSVAPSLSWESVATSIGLAFDILPLLKEAAMEKARSVAEEWSWKRQLADFSNMMKGMV